MPAPYSAGSIFLQVVPSFRGVPEAIAREARDWGEKSGKNFDESFEKHATSSAKRTGAKISKEMESSGGDAGEKAGKAYGGHFETAVRNAVQRAAREVGTIKVDADDAPARRKLDTLKRGLENLGKQKIGVDIDGAGAFAKLTAIEEGLREIQDRAKTIDARVNAAGALSEVAKIRSELMALSAIQIEPEVKVDYDTGAFRRGLKQAIDGALRDLGPVDMINLNMGDKGHQQLAQIRKELHDLADLRIGIDISDETAREKLAQFRDRLRQLQNEHVSINLDADTAAAEANLAAFLAVLDRVDGRTAHVDVDVDGRGLQAAASYLLDLDRNGKKAATSLDNVTVSGRRASGMGQDGANSFRAFNAMVLGVASLGPLVVPALGGIAAGIGGLLPLAAAGAAGIGVLVLGLYGIADAFKAMQAARDSSTKDMATWGKAVESAQRQVRNANESLADAQKAAGRAAEDSARRVSDAQRNLADAYEQASERSARAVRGVHDAEQSLADAQRAAQRAQEDLTRARKDAQDQLDELNLRLRDSALDQRQAVLDLHQAESDLAKARQAGATGDALEKYLVAYERARLRIDQVKETAQQLNDEQQKWAQTGVEGSDKVVAAQEKVVSSQQAIAHAQQALADARAEQAKTERDNARNIADAQRSVADAQRDQARAAADSQKAIVHAQEAVNDALDNYADALSKTSSAQDKLNQAMANLSPAGRSFVAWLDSMRPRFRELRGLASEGFLPGLQNWIDSIINGRGPLLESTVKRISGALGDMFTSFGESLRGEDFGRLFEMLDRSGPRFIGYMSKILVNLGEGIASLIAAMEPLGDLFGGWFVRLTASFREWARSLQGSQGLKDFFEWIQRIGPKIGELIHQLFRALVNLGIALAPYAEGLMSLLTGILRWIADMDPDRLRKIAAAILITITALQSLFGLTALFKSVQSAGHILGELGEKFGAFGKVLGWIPVLVGGLILLYQNSEKFRGAMDGLWHEVLEPLGQLLGSILMPLFEGLVSLLSDNITLIAGAATAWASWKILQQVITWVNTLRTSMIGLAIAQAAAGLGAGGAAGGIMRNPGNFTAGLGGGAAAGAAGGIAGGTLARAIPLAALTYGAYKLQTKTNDKRVDSWAESLLGGGEGAAKIQAKFADAKGMGSFEQIFGHTSLLLGDLWDDDHYANVIKDFNAAQSAASDYFKTLDPTAQAQAKVAEWTETLAYRQKTLGENSDQTAAAHRRLNYWTEELARHQGTAAEETTKLTDAFAEQQTAAIALADAEYAYLNAKQDLNQAYAEYIRVQADASATDEERRRAEEAWTNQARQTAEAARNAAIARHADADAIEQQKYGNAALLADLQRQKELYGQLPPYLEELRKSLERTVDPAVLAAAKMENLGLKVIGIPDKKTIFIESTTPEQLELLSQLGFKVETLPDGRVQVTAETEAAEAALAELTRPRTLLIFAQLTSARQHQEGEWAPVPGSPGRNARGGFIRGPGTWTSDSILSYLSNGEYVVRAASVSKYGLGLLDAINQGRYPNEGGYAKGGQVRQRKGLPAYADGGYVANWGGSMNLSGLAIPELATWWVQAVSTVTQVSAQAATTISQIFLGLRNAVLANFADTGTQLNNSWLGTITGLIRSATTGNVSISDLFTNLRDTLFRRSSETRDQQTGIFGQLRDGVSSIITDAVGRATRTWGTLPGGLLGPVNTLIDKVLNNGLFRAFNAIVGALGLDAKLNIPLQGPAKLAAGGRVPGYSPHDKADNIPAMLTAGEYVHPVDAVDYYGPEFMEAIRRKKLPRGILGYATGGYVAMQNAVKQQFPWARITSGFRAGDPGYHGKGLAIDIGGATPYPGAGSMAQMLTINHWIADHFRNITELIHTQPGAVNLWHGQPHTYNAGTQADHRNHVHWAQAGDLASGSGFLATLGKLLGVGAELLGDPAGYLRDVVGKALDGFGGGGVKDIMAGGARKLLDFAIDKVSGFLASAFGMGDDGYSDFSKASVGPIAEQVRQVFANYGWGAGAAWADAAWVMTKESGFNPKAQNPSSTASGLGQMIDSTWRAMRPAAASMYAHMKDAPVAMQADATARYMKQRYGGPSQTKAFWLQHHYYGEGGPVQDVDSATGGIVPDLHDTGGWVMPGLNVLMNRTGRPEPVINPATLDALISIGEGGHGDRALIGELNLPIMPQATPEKIAGEIMHHVTVASRGGKY